MKLLLAGDFCPQQRVAELFEKGEYEAVLAEVCDVTSKADYSIINLECPIIQGKEKPISKAGPNLYSTEKGVKALKWAGFNCVTLANNHFYDYGEEGVKQTIKVCNNEGVDMVGGGENLGESARTLYKKIKGKTISIINCCEHEFSIATNTSGGSNPLNPVHQYYAIREAKEHSDFILVIIHGGNEHYQLPSPRMKETYRFFVDVGADAVINHHQHCYSGYELYKGKPIFYGLGNFCFDNQIWRNSNWNKGYMVMIDTAELNNVEIIPYTQCDNTPNVSLLSGGDYKSVMLNVQKLNETIQDNKLLSESYELFINSTYKYMLLGFEPYNSSRLFTALYLRDLLPSFLTEKKINWLINFISCESHSPKLLSSLQLKKDKIRDEVLSK